MKRKSILLAIGLACASAISMAWDAVPVRVDEGVYAFVGETGPRTLANEGMNATTGFVVTDAGVVVIDSGSSKQVARKIEAAIRTVTDRPIRYVINTGGQDHRWLGNGHFADRGIPLLASEKTAGDIAERGPAQAASLEQLLGSSFAGTRVQPPTRLLATRETLTLGGERIELIFAGGGHTPGDLIVWLPRQRIAFAGDIVYLDRLLGVLPVSNLARWLGSFDALAALQPRIVVPGHGSPAPLSKAEKETRAYLARLRGHMKKAVDSGVDLQAAIQSLDDREHAYLAVYPELRGPNANRAYLEAEAE
jgi:glyoxylase-like metal-dependent hydrolase (beta-lactamase superfamily II)